MAMKLFLKDGNTILLDAPSAFRINPVNDKYVDGLDGSSNAIALVIADDIVALQMQ